MNKPFLLGVDLGTSALKAVLFDASGEILASASADYPLQQPRNGWAEQEPEDWFSAAVRVIRQITETTGAAADIAAKCGYSSLCSFNRSFKALVGKSPTEYRECPLP